MYSYVYVFVLALALLWYLCSIEWRKPHLQELTCGSENILVHTFVNQISHKLSLVYLYTSFVSTLYSSMPYPYVALSMWHYVCAGGEE